MELPLVQDECFFSFVEAMEPYQNSNLQLNLSIAAESRAGHSCSIDNLIP